MPRLSELKDIDFVDISKAEVEREVFALYETITGRTLAAGDPVRLFILFIVKSSGKSEPEECQGAGKPFR